MTIIGLAELLVGAATAREAFEGTDWYVGDLHAHTSYSADGASRDAGVCVGECGSIEDLFATARGNGLDFVAITDHLNGNVTEGRPQIAEEAFAAWWAMVLAGSSAEDGFVVIPAGEVYFGTATLFYGHKTLLLFGADEALRDFAYADAWPSGVVDYATLDDCAQIAPWLDDLQARFGAVLALPHHPMATHPMPTDWACHTAAYEPAVEVYSRHGNSLDPRDPYDPLLQGISGPGAVTLALDPDGYAYDLGFIAATDRHDTRPGEVCAQDQSLPASTQYGGGLTLVALPEGAAFDRAAIHDAIVDHRTVASSGPAIPVGITFDADGAALGGLGDALLVPEGAVLSVRVSVPARAAAAVLGVDLVGPGGPIVPLVVESEGVWGARVPLEVVRGWVYVDVRVDGDVWWGPGACVDGGFDAEEHLWASPNQVRIGPPQGDTGGDSGGNGDTGTPDTASTDTASTETGASDGGVDPPSPCGCGGGAGVLALALWPWSRRRRGGSWLTDLPPRHPHVGHVGRAAVEHDRG